LDKNGVLDLTLQISILNQFFLMLKLLEIYSQVGIY
jgi:hypothetical protein